MAVLFPQEQEAFLQQRYGAHLNTSVRHHYQYVENLVNAQEGQPILAAISSYEPAHDYDATHRWVSHSYNTRLELGRLLLGDIRYQLQPSRAWLDIEGVRMSGAYRGGEVHVEPLDELVLASLLAPRQTLAHQRDIGYRLGTVDPQRRRREFPRNLVTKYEKSPALRPYIQLHVGAAAIKHFLRHPGVGAPDEIRHKVASAFELLEMEL